MPTELELALSKKGKFSPQKEGLLWEHFIGNTSPPPANFVYVSGGAGAGSQAMGGIQGRPGIHRGNTGSTATGWFSFRAGQSGAVLPGGNCFWEFAGSVRIPTLASGTEDFDICAGFSSATAGTLGLTDGAYFLYDIAIAQWVARCINANAITNVNTGITVVANQFYDLKVEINPGATEAKFFINEALAATISTNIPNNRPVAPIFQIIKSLGTISRSLDVDYYHSYWKQS